MNKTSLALTGLLMLAAVSVAPTASAVDPCDAYGACVVVAPHGVFVGDCDKLTCAGVWQMGDRTCVGVSFQVPFCVSTN